MELKLALKVDDLDNVATIFANGIVDGAKVEVRDKKGEPGLPEAGFLYPAFRQRSTACEYINLYEKIKIDRKSVV